MKLSIITINLNNADGLRKTMMSVINQAFKDFEFIVVDGFSTDGSIGVIQDCLGCADKRMRTRWVSELDSGIYNAMNKGIRMSSGEYLLFLNSGDCLADNEVLDKVKNKLIKDIVVCRCNVLENGIIVWSYIPKEIYTFGTIYFYGIAHQSTFIRKSVFERFGIYDESYKYNGDIEFWYRAIIDNKVSTQALNTVISNYSLGGVSDVLKNNPEFVYEHKRILSNPAYEKFIDDYEQWAKDREWIAKYRIIEKYSPIIRWLIVLEKVKRRFHKVFLIACLFLCPSFS